MPALSLAIDTPDLAQHYETVSADRQFKAGQRLIDKLDVTPGERALDIGSGTGLLAEYVARRVGPKGSVVGIDPLPLRIEIAKRRAATNLRFAVGDAYALESFPAGGFDVVYLNAVFHWLPEKLAPLRGIRRLLAPGGRLGISTGARDQTNTIQEVRNRVLSREPFRRYPDADRGVGHHVSVEELRKVLKEAGFEIGLLEVEPHSTHHPTPEAAIQFAQASSFGNYLGRIPEEVRDAARREIAAELEELRTPEGILQVGTRIVAVARKSAS